MTATQVIAQPDSREMLAEAQRRRVHIVVTRRTARGWETVKGTLAAPAGSPDLLMAQIAQPDVLIDPPAVPGETIGVSFRAGHKKCMFSTTLTSINRQGNAIQICFPPPDSIQQLQRRVYERVEPSPGTIIPIRFWPAGDTCVAVEDRHIRHGQLEDISAGGMRLRVPELADLQFGSAYQCVITPHQGAAPLMLEAVLKHHQPTGTGRASLGFQFIGLECSADGRRQLDRLARLVNQLQRARARRGQTGRNPEP